MDKTEVLDEFRIIENKYNIKFPDKYKEFLSEEVKGQDVYEIQNGQGNTIYYL